MYFFRHLATVLCISSFSINVTVFAHGFAYEDSRLSAPNEVTEASYAIIRSLRKDNKRWLGIDLRNWGRYITAVVNPRSPGAGANLPVPQSHQPGPKTNIPRSNPQNGNNGHGGDPSHDKRGGGSSGGQGGGRRPGDRREGDPSNDPNNPRGGGPSGGRRVSDPSNDPNYQPGDGPSDVHGGGVRPYRGGGVNRNTTSITAISTSSPQGASIGIFSSNAASPTAASPSSNPTTTDLLLPTSLATPTVSSSPATNAAAAGFSAGNPLSYLITGILGAVESFWSDGRKWGFAMTGILFYLSMNFVHL